MSQYQQIPNVCLLQTSKSRPIYTIVISNITVSLLFFVICFSILFHDPVCHLKNTSSDSLCLFYTQIYHKYVHFSGILQSPWCLSHHLVLVGILNNKVPSTSNFDYPNSLFQNAARMIFINHNHIPSFPCLKLNDNFPLHWRQKSYIFHMAYYSVSSRHPSLVSLCFIFPLLCYSTVIQVFSPLLKHAKLFNYLRMFTQGPLILPGKFLLPLLFLCYAPQPSVHILHD